MTEQVIFTNPSNERQIAEYVTYTHKEAGFWMRFWAFLIDTLVVSAIVGICIKPIFQIMDWDVHSNNWYAPIVILTGIIYYAYFVLLTKFFAQTVGKMVFGLKVLTDSGEKLDWVTVLFREMVGRFISNTFLHLPYIIVAVTPQHKAVHDFIADTVVVHEESYKETRKKRFLQDEELAQSTEQQTALVESTVQVKESQVIEQEIQHEEDHSLQDVEPSVKKVDDTMNTDTNDKDDSSTTQK